jgi:myotubularin-related protein 1/2
MHALQKWYEQLNPNANPNANAFWFIILLSSLCRTFDGFATLIEKDFVSFGHPFQMRCGHGYDSHTRPDNEISPIFLQFLDCTFQLVSQFPQYFEFSTKYVLTIADHVYSCRFGTFLGNSDKERVRTNCPKVVNDNV